MIVDKDFIKSYNKLFKFLRAIDEQTVIDFWQKLADTILGELKESVKQKGLAGCFEYWSRTLSQEGADCLITLDTKEQVFKITMRQCPSLAVLDKPNKEYCQHCDVLYRSILEPLGYKYEIDYNGRGQCEIRITTNASI